MNFKIACVVCYIVAAGMISTLPGEVNSHDLRCRKELYNTFIYTHRSFTVPKGGYLYFCDRSKDEMYSNLNSGDQENLVALRLLWPLNIQYGIRQDGIGKELFIEGVAFCEFPSGPVESKTRIQPFDHRMTDAEKHPFYDKFIKILITMPDLKYLDLYYFDMTRQNVEKLGVLTGLNYLGLPNSSTDDYLNIISRFKELSYLNGSWTKITGAGWQYLADLPELMILDMRGNTLDPDYLPVLGQIPKLNKLLLAHSTVKDEDLKAIGELSSIEYLELHFTRITDRGTDYLEKMKQLKYLSLYNTAVTPRRVEQLRKVLPDTTIIIDWNKDSERLYRHTTCETLATLGNREALLTLAAMEDCDNNERRLYYAIRNKEPLEGMLSSDPMLKYKYDSYCMQRDLLKKYLKYEPISWDQQPLYQYAIDSDKDVEQPIVFEEAAK